MKQSDPIINEMIESIDYNWDMCNVNLDVVTGRLEDNPIKEVDYKVLKKGSDASTRTKRQASLAKTLRSFHADGGLTGVSGYKPGLGNNRFGYPSGGVPVRNFRGGGAALRGLGRALTKK